MASERLDGGRRRFWLGALGVTCVLGAIALGALWWERQGFDPGDSTHVVAHIGECGYVRTDAGGEEWQSEEPRPGNFRGAIISGSLERLSEDEAVYRESDGAPGLLMLRIGSGDFWPASGCIEPDI